MMRKYILLILFIPLHFTVSACAACEAQQPRILRGITHGTGPGSKWDIVIVCAAVIIVLLTLFYAVKWLVRPGERSEAHIKQFILNNE